MHFKCHICIGLHAIIFVYQLRGFKKIRLALKENIYFKDLKFAVRIGNYIIF